MIDLADGRAANPFESVLRAVLIGMPGVAVEPQQWVGNVGRADLVVRFGWRHVMFDHEYVRATVRGALAAHRQETRRNRR